MINSIKRGGLYYADLSPAIGSEQNGIRPVVIIQNNTGNKHAPTTIIAPLTSQSGKKKLPTHVQINSEEYSLKNDSVVLVEQSRAIDKSRLKDYIDCISEDKMLEIDTAIAISFGLTECLIYQKKPF